MAGELAYDRPAAFVQALPQDQVARLGGRRLTPGMPVEVFVQTRQRSIMSYLTGPLTDQLQRAFRD